MTTNKKIILIVVVLFFLCGGCAITSLLIYLPYRDNSVKTQTVLTSAAQSAGKIEITKTPFIPPVTVNSKIPFETVVLITALYKENGQYQEGWTGSGTFISSDGLILTNAHVVLPDKNFKVDALTISPTINPDDKPEPLYYAKVVQADANLDLAVLKISTDLAGNPIDMASLQFPFVKIGNSDELSLGDKITILGYPGIGGDTITLTSGEVAGFTSESQYGNRAFIKTSATIAGGNSGGLGADKDGNLVGIPTQLGSGGDSGIVDCRTLADTNRDGVIDENDTCVPTGGFINSLRPIKMALPLIEAARKGEENIVAEIVPEQTALPQTGDVMHQDDFSNTSSGWTIQNDQDGTVGYVNDEYQINVTTPMMFISGTSGKEVGDAIISVTSHIRNATSQGDYGLLCRQQSDGSYYAFEVSEDGYASIWKNIGGEISPLIDWKFFQGLESQPELQLSASCIGDQLDLAVDGQVLLSTTDTSLQAGDTGLIAGTWDTPGFTVAFDDFVIRSPQ
jgi:S1-C subfamily serine protease